MSTLYLAAVVLFAPPATEATDSATKSAPATVLSAKELREAFRDAVRTSYQGEPREAVPKLVKAYQVLQGDKLLSNSERAELKRRLRSRMITMGDKIVEVARREMKKRQQEEAKSKGKQSATQSTSASSSGQAVASASTAAKGAAGGRGEDDADELIELIRTVIKPESWDVNGGPGTMFYYRPAMALVITQTQEVHWLIGGLRGALGR